MSNFDSPWNSETIKLLAQMALDGHTAAGIARALQISRNAVIGKCHRLKIKLGNRPYMEKYVPPPISRTRNKQLNPKQFRKRNQNSGLGSEAIWAGESISLLDAKSGQCLWPKGIGRGGLHLCCGAPICRGSYCQTHYEISTSGKLPMMNANYIAWKSR